MVGDLWSSTTQKWISLLELHNVIGADMLQQYNNDTNLFKAFGGYPTHLPSLSIVGSLKRKMESCHTSTTSKSGHKAPYGPKFILFKMTTY